MQDNARVDFAHGDFSRHRCDSVTVSIRIERAGVATLGEAAESSCVMLDDDDAPKPVLRLVQTAPHNTDPRRALETWRCRVCAEAGRPSGALVPVVLEAWIQQGAIVPGDRAYACAVCMFRGVVTFV